MQLIWNHHGFEARPSAQWEFERVRKAGFEFSPAQGCFTTKSLKVAARLRQYADEGAREILNRYFIERKPWTGRIQWPYGLKPLDFQVPAATFILERNRSYLAADPGLGKGVITALIANALPDQPFVIICPPHLIYNVQAEIDKWGVRNKLLTICGPKGPEYSDARILIVPDSLIARREIQEWIKEHNGLGDGVLVVDEAHRFNHGSSKRTKALLGKGGIASRFEKVAWLSGTPMPNRPMDLYTILSKQAPETINFRSRFDYGFRYCGGYIEPETGTWVFKGASNQERLRSHVHGKFMLRLKKRDVLKSLPPKSEEVVIIGPNVPRTLTALDRKLAQQWGEPDQAMDEEHISTYRKKIGIAKVPACLEVIKDVLRGGDEKILIFAHHIDVVAMLVDGLKEYAPLAISGKTSKPDRQARVNLFQNDDACRILIGNIQASGTGFTLTKATRVIFVEWSWVPAENEQASDRAHRIGQREAVHVQYLVFKNSLDKVVLETNLRKRQVTDQI